MIGGNCVVIGQIVDDLMTQRQRDLVVQIYRERGNTSLSWEM